MAEKHLIGNVYTDDADVIGRSEKYGVSAIVRNRAGQGLTLPLDNLTPNDLRYLADFLEAQENRMHQD